MAHRDSGTGKSCLLIALGTAAAEAGYRVRCTLASTLVDELTEVADDEQLSKTITPYGGVDLSASTSSDRWNSPPGTVPWDTDVRFG